MSEVHQITIYDPATGEILGAGMRSGAGSVVVADGQGNPFDQWVNAGTIVLYTPEQRAAKLAKPSYPCHWDNSLMQWVDDRTFEQAKADAWDAIKTARENAMSQPLVVTGIGTFDADPVSRSNIAQAVQLAQTLQAQGQPSDIGFTLADNTHVTLTVTQMVTVGLTLGQQVQAAYAHGSALREQLDALDPATATPAQALAITW